MSIRKSLLVWSTLLLCAACGGGGGDFDLGELIDQTGDGFDLDELGEPTAATRAEPSPSREPIDRALSTLVTQVAPWAGLELSIVRARLFRGEEPGVVWGDGRATYALLDVRIVAIGRKEADLRYRDTWDLLLADGRRLRPARSLGVALLPGDDVTATIAYNLDAMRSTAGSEVTLEGAELEVNGRDRNVLEPLRIPLDAPRAFESPIRLPELEGLELEAGDEDGLAFEVLSATYGLDIPSQDRRATIGHRCLSVALRLNHRWRYDVLYNSDREGPRIAYGGGTYQAPTVVLEMVKRGGDLDVTVDLLVETGVTDFELVFNTGAPELRRIPVHVPLQ